MSELEILKKVIRQAGQEVLTIYNRDDFEVNIKEVENRQSPVTEADLRAEQIILDGLKQFGYAILSEETDDDLGRLEKEKVWIIDPMDGTADFVKKTGDFSIMVGLAERGKVVLGAVYRPVGDKLYYAVKGRGAYLQIGAREPQPIKVSDITKTENARLIGSRLHLSQFVKDFARKIGCEIVQSGSAGLKACLVAENQADIFIIAKDHSSEWDVCAADIIVSEAGGRMSDLNGQNIIYNKKQVRNLQGIAVTNGHLHDFILEQIKLIKK